MTNVINYGEISIDVDSLPAVSTNALLRRGLAHFLGNEQAAKVSAFKEKNPEATESQVLAYKAECVANAVAALNAGTVGANVRGPRGTAIETIMRKIASDEVKTVLAALKVKAPKGEEKVKFANGDSFTMNELIARRLEKHADRITAEANKAMKDAARKAEKIAAESDL
jgi:hypothetical protein